MPEGNGRYRDIKKKVNFLSGTANTKFINKWRRKPLSQQERMGHGRGSFDEWGRWEGDSTKRNIDFDGKPIRPRKNTLLRPRNKAEKLLHKTKKLKPVKAGPAAVAELILNIPSSERQPKNLKATSGGKIVKADKPKNYGKSLSGGVKTAPGAKGGPKGVTKKFTGYKSTAASRNAFRDMVASANKRSKRR